MYVHCQTTRNDVSKIIAYCAESSLCNWSVSIHRQPALIQTPQLRCTREAASLWRRLLASSRLLAAARPVPDTLGSLLLGRALQRHQPRQRLRRLQPDDGRCRLRYRRSSARRRRPARRTARATATASASTTGRSRCVSCSNTSPTTCSQTTALTTRLWASFIDVIEFCLTFPVFPASPHTHVTPVSKPYSGLNSMESWVHVVFLGVYIIASCRFPCFRRFVYFLFNKTEP